jgi:hypothetical protein
MDEIDAQQGRGKGGPSSAMAKAPVAPGESARRRSVPWTVRWAHGVREYSAGPVA